MAPFGTPQPKLTMSDEEYRLLRNLIYDECGIWLKDEKKSFLENRTFNRMRTLKIASCYRYYRLLTDPDDGKQEVLTFMDSVTINETSFFRNKPQMDIFTEMVVPEIVSNKRKKGDLSLKIWSAGCSTGQEPYTLAMILRETIPDMSKWKITILASDLSLTALQSAQEGIYRPEKMDGVDDTLRSRYFREVEGGMYQAKDVLKQLIVFDFHNLMHESGSGNFDVIFCRNVLIYFDEETQKGVIDRFDRALVPEGYLFLGHTESLQGVNDNFTFIHKNKGTAYKKNG